MYVDARTFVSTVTTNLSLRLRESGMNIGSLMTWWHKLLKVKVDLCGLAKTMMEMSSLTRLHKVRLNDQEKTKYKNG